MRAHQIWNGPWIDLDHVLEVTPPKFVNRMGHGGYFIEMDLRFAFQDQPRTFRWQQKGIWIKDKDHKDQRFGHFDGPELTSLGVPTKMELVILKVYRPLMRAWTNKAVDPWGPVTTESSGYEPTA